MRSKWHKIVIILAVLLWSSVAFAYDDQTTHPALTDEIVDFYNLSFDKKLTMEEKEWIVSGVMSEDTPPRWINHFYDPVNKVGWSGESTGVWPTMLIQYFSNKIISSADPVSSLDWLHNQQLQSEYGEYGGNRTWERAIYEYANGNTKEAYVTLGYILHLVEDATVPDHTRNDTHAHELRYATGDYGSPYEEFNKQFTRNSLNIAAELKRRGSLPVIRASADDYILSLAEYSNQYFFSKDTINDSKYILPKIVKEENGFGYGQDQNGEEFELVKIRTEMIGNYEIKTFYDLQNKPSYYPILSQYFTRLSREALINGAGVVDLFLREGEKAKQNLAALEKPPQETAGIDSWMDEIYGLANVWQAARSGASSAVDYVVSVVTDSDIIPQTANLASPIGAEINKSQSEIAMEKIIPSGFSLIKNFYGSSLELQDVQELSGDQNQASVVALAIPEEPSVAETLAPVAPNVATVLEPASQTKTVQGGTLDESVETIPDWYPRQAGSLSQDSAGGGGATTNNSQPTTNNAGIIQGGTSDESATTTASTTPAAIPDTTPPDIALSINECATSISTSTAGCLLLSGNVSISWNSVAPDLAEFELTINGAIFPLVAATSTSATTTLADNTTHTIFLRAKDTIGNWSSPETKNIAISSRPVVINEVAWAGTASAYPYDEWIELYNRTDQDISLSGWVFYSSSMKPYIPLIGIIAAKSYFLLERTDNDTVSDITADLVYGNDGPSFALNNDGEALYLSYASTTIDQTTPCGTGYYKWCPGTSVMTYATAELRNPDISGTDQTNWGFNLYQPTIRNGKNATSSAILGTPKARNSVNYLVNGSQNISTNLTLTKSSSPYVVPSNITVNTGATLTIEPGVVIKFSNIGTTGILNVNGTLLAQGTTSTPIVFTSFYDDAYGGDTNGDATTTAPAPGGWYGVALKQGSDASVIDNSIFRYGGLYYTGQGQLAANLSIENSSPSITYSIFEHSLIYGLKIQNSSSTISNNIIRNNNNFTDPAGVDVGLYISGGAPQILNNTFQNNHRGLYLQSSAATVSNNTFTNHTREAVYSWSSNAGFTGNSGSINTPSGIVLSGTPPSSNYTLSLNSLPYVPNGFTVASSSVLNIDPGTAFKPQGNFYVYGEVNLNGASPEDIIFTSLADDSVSGDTTNDGAQTPAPGGWIGIKVFAGGSLRGGGATFRYGGYGESSAASVMLAGGSANLHDTIFKRNYPHGLSAASGANLNIVNSVFRDHDFAGQWGVKAALSVWGSTINMSSVTFENNAFAIMSDTGSLWNVINVVFNNNLATTSPANLF